MRQSLSELRHLACPFESVESRPDAIAVAAITAASKHLNPRNGAAGCNVWRLCRRLGCDSDALPLLRSANVSRAQHLM